MPSAPPRLLRRTRSYWRACWSSRYGTRPRHGRAKSERRHGRLSRAPLGFPTSDPVVPAGNCANLRYSSRVSGATFTCAVLWFERGRKRRGQYSSVVLSHSQTLPPKHERQLLGGWRTGGCVKCFQRAFRDSLSGRRFGRSQRAHREEETSHSPPSSSYLGAFQ